MSRIYQALSRYDTIQPGDECCHRSGTSWQQVDDGAVGKCPANFSVWWGITQWYFRHPLSTVDKASRRHRS